MPGVADRGALRPRVRVGMLLSHRLHPRRGPGAVFRKNKPKMTTPLLATRHLTHSRGQRGSLRPGCRVDARHRTAWLMKRKPMQASTGCDASKPASSLPRPERLIAVANHDGALRRHHHENVNAAKRGFRYNFSGFLCSISGVPVFDYVLELGIPKRSGVLAHSFGIFYSNDSYKHFELAVFQESCR